MSETTEAEPQALPGDGLREGIVDELRRRIGDAVVATELRPNDDLWIRVATGSWKATGEALYQMGFEYFCFLSAIDWKPSPYGRGEDDPTEPPPERTTEIRQGVTGGDTRFQLLARVTDIRRHVGVTLKADVPDDSLTMESWYTVYAGANWHERETHEMFGIEFAGHPDLRNMYLPSEFEGFPLRKDFPLLSRMVKPWPGIVDVEPMPDARRPRAAPGPADAGVGEPPAVTPPRRRPQRPAPKKPPTSRRGGGESRTSEQASRRARGLRRPTAAAHGRAGASRASGRGWRATHDRPPVRTPAALLHRRPGGRRPAQRRAGDRGHDAEHRAPAPGDPRHAADHRPPRRRTGRVGRAVVRLHAPRLRETDRGPHLPPGHDARQPHRLARQLRQRGAVHPRRREADGGRGAAAGAMDPHDPVRALAHRQHRAVPR